MAIRGDNPPPGSTPGSITQSADSNIDRIGNVSNVSKTVSNMQKDVKQRITETKTAVDEGQQISMVQKSMTTVLDKLAGTVEALSNGVKTITVDTAKATKDTISQYGKAISEDISFNKQHTVAMALAKTTPIYGYFAAKFMETDVFKKAAERMKTSIGKAFGSLAGVFRRGKKGPGEDTAIPKMHSGGFVKKGGLTELHAGEIVAPIEKILKRIDDSISTTKDLAKITEKTALHMTTDLKGYIKSSSSSDKSQMNVFRSFIRTYKEVGERAFTEQPVERMARSLLAIQDVLGAQIGNMSQVWQEMLTTHPGLVKLRLSLKAISGVLTTPYKIVRAFMRVRGFGGYRTKLSKAKNPLQATAENIATLYVDLMWRLDNMMPLIRLSAEANRDTAAKLTGKTYKRVKGVPKEKKWSINQVASAALGLVPGLAIGGLGKGVGKLGSKMFEGKTGKAFKKGGDLSGSLAKWLMTGGGAQEDKKGLLSKMGGGFRDLFVKQKDQTLLAGTDGEKGATQGPAMWVTDTNVNQVALDYKKWVEFEASQVPVQKKQLLIEHKVWQDKYKFLKADRVNAVWMGDAAKKQVSMLGKLRKTLKGNRWIQYLLVAWGFLKTVIGGIFSPFKRGLMALLGINAAGNVIGGGGGILGGLRSLFGKGGSAEKTFGKKGSATKFFGKKGKLAKFFGKKGTLAKKMGSLFGRKGLLMKGMSSLWTVGSPMVMSIGKGLIGMLASGPFWAAIAAAGIGLAIGTLINKYLISPWLDKLDKDIQKKKAETELKNKTYVQQQLIKARTGETMEQKFAGKERTNLQNISKGRVGEAQKQGYGKRIMGMGDVNIPAIQEAQNEYRREHADEYLKYSPEERDYWRLDFIENFALNRGWFRDPHKYGLKREEDFLKYLQRRGTVETESSRSARMLATYQKKKKPIKQMEAGSFKPISPMKLLDVPEEKKKSWWQKLWGQKDKGEEILVKKLAEAKGVGKNWWSKLDTKSRAAFEEAKKYYIKERGMTEAEADAQIASLAMKVGDRYDLMTNPETYKQFGKGVSEEYKERRPQVEAALKEIYKDAGAEYRERLPGIIDKKDIIIKEATLQMANAEKMSVEFGKEVGKQTKELVDTAKENTVAGTTAVVTTISETYNSVASSPTVVNAGEKVQGVYQAGKDWAAEIVLDGDSD